MTAEVEMIELEGLRSSLLTAKNNGNQDEMSLGLKKNKSTPSPYWMICRFIVAVILALATIIVCMMDTSDLSLLISSAIPNNFDFIHTISPIQVINIGLLAFHSVTFPPEPDSSWKLPLNNKFRICMVMLLDICGQYLRFLYPVDEGSLGYAGKSVMMINQSWVIAVQHLYVNMFNYMFRVTFVNSSDPPPDTAESNLICHMCRDINLLFFMEFAIQLYLEEYALMEFQFGLGQQMIWVVVKMFILYGIIASYDLDYSTILIILIFPPLSCLYRRGPPNVGLIMWIWMWEQILITVAVVWITIIDFRRAIGVDENEASRKLRRSIQTQTN